MAPVRKTKTKPKVDRPTQYQIVKVAGFEGEVSSIVATPDPVYMVIGIYADGTNAELDNGYRSLEEAVEAWPGAGRPRD